MKQIWSQKTKRLIVGGIDTLFFTRTYFVRISRLKSAKFQEYFKNKNDAEILKRISIISYSSLIVSVSPSAQRQTE